MAVKMRDRKPKQSIASAVLGGNDGEQVDDLLLTDLNPFQNHPFKIVEDDNFHELMESIQNHGVNTPIIVRPQSHGKFEIISGHRRVKACKLLEIKNIPSFIRDLDDEEAIFQMVDTNIHREQLFPSEKAFAYKMKLEAIKRQGKREDLTCSPVGNKLEQGKKSAEIVAEESGETKNQIFRYIRLTELTTPFLDMVDSKKLPFQTAVELSYLTHEEQDMVLEVMEKTNLIPSLEQAKSMKGVSKLGELNRSLIETYLIPPQVQGKKVSVKVDSSKYFPENTPKEEVQQLITTLLEEWFSKQSENKTDPLT